MIIPIGCDHAGFKTKELIVKHLTNKGFQIKDFGCYSESSIDYPDYAHPVAQMVEENPGMRNTMDHLLFLLQAHQLQEEPLSNLVYHHTQEQKK